jgi:methylmalonyl-CoA/ethylmalonyl-CoA epimerase
MAHEIDHIAVLTSDTEEALHFYRDQLRLPIVFSEVLEDQRVWLTHLDLGGVQLQLVQPLSADHPLVEQLRARGEVLHHLCFRVPKILTAVEEFSAVGLSALDSQPRSAPRGKKAVFLNPAHTRGILIEITGPGETAE